CAPWIAEPSEPANPNMKATSAKPASTSRRRRYTAARTWIPTMPPRKRKSAERKAPVCGDDRATMTNAIEYRKPPIPTTIALAPEDRSNEGDDAALTAPECSEGNEARRRRRG